MSQIIATVEPAIAKGDLAVKITENDTTRVLCVLDGGEAGLQLYRIEEALESRGYVVCANWFARAEGWGGVVLAAPVRVV